MTQTGKMKRVIPVVFIGRQFWNECVNLQAFVDYWMISQEDKDQLISVDTAEEAFDHFSKGLIRLESSWACLAP